MVRGAWCDYATNNTPPLTTLIGNVDSTPPLPSLPCIQGNCLGRTGDTQGAIDMYRKSIALNSSTTNWNGRFMLAQTLYISGRERMTPQLLKQVTDLQAL